VTRNGEGIVVAGGVRTAIGRFAGAFKDTPSSDLGANAIRAAVGRAGISPDVVDEVILGCVGQVGEDAFNARLATLKAGLPEKTTAFNVNRLCGSGLQAINSAVQEVRTGEYLTGILAKNGFKITRGVAGIPTAWTATWGEGGPLIAMGSDDGFVAIFDLATGALTGLPKLTSGISALLFSADNGWLFAGGATATMLFVPSGQSPLTPLNQMKFPSAITQAAFVNVPTARAFVAVSKGATGTANVLFVSVQSIEVGTARSGPLRVAAHDIEFGTGDGLLGRDFLDNFIVTIDSAARVVTLTPKK